MTSSVQSKSPTTAAFFFQAATAFAISTGSLVIGIAFLPIDPWVRAFLALSAVFTVSSAFTLAKCVRDRQEESYVSNRVDRARVDKLIAEHDPFKIDV